MPSFPAVVARAALLLPLLAAPPAAAGLFGKREAPVTREDPPPRVEAKAPPSRRLPDAGPLWGHALPIPTGPLAAGLANASAQGCAACHAGVVHQWRATAHAAAPPPALIEAAEVAGRPDCLSCHLPLEVQHRSRFAPDPAEPSRQVTAVNPAFDATLASEGATCVACHLRDGHLVGPRADVSPPHATRASAALRASSACASCHQLAWPGADRPLYDTFGEWQRSAWAEAGVTCQSCHMAPIVAGAAPTHDVRLPAAQALSVLATLPPDAIVRGRPERAGALRLQNTGAGHAFPTGSPFRGARIEAVIEGPAERGDGTKVWHVAGSASLRRTIEGAPPFRTTADTRLPAGAAIDVPLALALPVDAPRGAYRLVVRLVPTRGETDAGAPVTLSSLALPVQ
jgi:hypothetical protein